MMDKFSNIISENKLMLLRMYEESRKQMLSYMLDAAMKGNDVKHLRAVRNHLDDEIIKLKKQFKIYSTDVQAQTYSAGIKEQEAAYRQLKIAYEPVMATSFNAYSGLHKEAIKTLAINTYKPLNKVTEIVGRDCIEFVERTNFKSTQDILLKLSKFYPDSERLREMGLKYSRDVVVGSRSWQQGMRDFQKDFAKNGIFKVPYYTKSGDLHALVNVRDYASLVARTTTAETYRRGAQNSILETFDGNDLVQIIGISEFPNSPCVPYQGRILSLTGKTEGYTTLDEAESNGLFHVNCIHHFAVTLDVINEYERKNIDY